MKRLIILILVTIIASRAYAEIQEFKYFSVDVPDDWTAEEKDNEVRITADDKTGELVIIAAEPNEKSIADIASEFCVKFGGYKLVSDDEGTFTFEFSGREGQKIITSDENFSDDEGQKTIAGDENFSDGEGQATIAGNENFPDGKGQATITGDENFYMAIMASGFEKNGDTLGEILNSLEMK